jgi:hypothetical protein
MATLEELTVKITADTSAMRTSLKNITAQTQSATSKMSASFGAASFAVRGFVAAFSVRAIVGFGQNVIDAAGKLNDLSQRIGFTASTLSALEPALVTSGSSVEALAGVVARLNNILGEAARGNETAKAAFEGLGLSVDNLLSLTPEQRFLAVADALGKISDQSALAEAGQNLFGRSFAQIIPLIKEANGNLSEYVETQKAAGAALSDETIATLDRFGDAAESAWMRARNAAATALAAAVEYVEYVGSTTLDERVKNAGISKAADAYSASASSRGFVTSASRGSAGVDLSAEYEARYGKISGQKATATAVAADVKKVTAAVKEQKTTYDELEKVRREQADAERQRQFLMQQYALSFESAFEGAIIEGKNLSDVLKGLSDDILRTLLRTQITAPLSNSISSGLGSLFSGGNFFSSIMSSLPSFAVGTPYVPHDMVAKIHKGEAIVPANQNRAGGGVTVNVINNSSAKVQTKQGASGNGTDIQVMIDEAVAANMSRSGSKTSQAMGAYNSRALTRR